MQNSFYNNFDIERLKESTTDKYRSPFQVDRDRIIHSSEFRRLQGKTQVFLPGEYDYYRTRLTHSIEVSQIGRSICNYLKKTESDFFNDEYFIDSDLVETACLSHDLGNPPFGHPCEKEINRLMSEYSGYEGNAQTLRLLTEIFYKTAETKRGMNPCRATVDGILKYKALYSQFEEHPENHFLYNTQKEFLDFVFNGRDINQHIKSINEINKFRSIEAQIMDWSDDTAYSINDLVDSISGGFMTIDKIEKWATNNNLKLSQLQKGYIEKIISSIKDGSYKRKFSAEIGEFISAVSIKERDTFMNDLTNRYKYELVIKDPTLEKVSLYKELSSKIVFSSAQLHQIEFKGKSIIKNIFLIFKENYIDEVTGEKLLPEFTHDLLQRTNDKKERARMICDYISGMTDSYALRIYKRLFDPDYSSLSDLI